MDSRTQSAELRLDAAYFLSDPHCFARDHWCEAAACAWQMLERPVSLAEFERSPLLAGFDIFGFTACKVEGDESPLVATNGDSPCENVVSCRGAMFEILLERKPNKWTQPVSFFYNVVASGEQEYFAGHKLLDFGV